MTFRPRVLLLFLLAATLGGVLPVFASAVVLHRSGSIATADVARAGTAVVDSCRTHWAAAWQCVAVVEWDDAAWPPNELVNILSREPLSGEVRVEAHHVSTMDTTHDVAQLVLPAGPHQDVGGAVGALGLAGGLAGMAGGTMLAGKLARRRGWIDDVDTTRA